MGSQDLKKYDIITKLIPGITTSVLGMLYTEGGTAKESLITGEEIPTEITIISEVGDMAGEKTLSLVGTGIGILGLEHDMMPFGGLFTAEVTTISGSNPVTNMNIMLQLEVIQ